MSAFPEVVSAMLAAVGGPAAAIDHERSLMSPICIGPARNRSLISSPNEFRFLARMHFITKRNDPLDIIARELAEVPLILLFKDDCASTVTRRLFGSIDEEIPRRSASEFCGSAWTRQDSPSALRGLDPPGALQPSAFIGATQA